MLIVLNVWNDSSRSAAITAFSSDGIVSVAASSSSSHGNSVRGWNYVRQLRKEKWVGLL